MLLSENAQTPVLDMSVRNQLRDALGPVAEQIFSKSQEQILRLVGEISESARMGDTSVAAARAHELGGVAGQVGLARLSAMALAVERGLRNGPAPETDFPQILERVADESRQALSA